MQIYLQLINDDTKIGSDGNRPVTFIKIHGRQIMYEFCANRQSLLFKSNVTIHIFSGKIYIMSANDEYYTSNQANNNCHFNEILTKFNLFFGSSRCTKISEHIFIEIISRTRPFQQENNGKN